MEQNRCKGWSTSIKNMKLQYSQNFGVTHVKTLDAQRSTDQGHLQNYLIQNTTLAEESMRIFLQYFTKFVSSIVSSILYPITISLLDGGLFGACVCLCVTIWFIFWYKNNWDLCFIQIVSVTICSEDRLKFKFAGCTMAIHVAVGNIAQLTQQPQPAV